MSTLPYRKLQLPLRPHKLLIAHVTRLQPFIVGGDSFREHVEALILHNRRFPTRLYLYPAGTFNNPNLLHDPPNGCWPATLHCCIMDAYTSLYSTGSVPALFQWEDPWVKSKLSLSGVASNRFSGLFHFHRKDRIIRIQLLTMGIKSTPFKRLDVSGMWELLW